MRYMERITLEFEKFAFVKQGQRVDNNVIICVCVNFKY